MTEYIEREKAMFQIDVADFVRDNDFQGGATLLFYDDVVDRLSAIPAADVRPVAWFDVNDRLPDLHDDVWEDGDEIVRYKVSDPVLCVYNGGEQTVAVYEIDNDVDFGGWVNCHDSSNLHTVTHWMELPALPEEAE